MKLSYTALSHLSLEIELYSELIRHRGRGQCRVGF